MRRTPERVVSELDPDFEFPELGSAFRGRHLRLRFHDIHVATDGQTLPTHDHNPDTSELVIARALRRASWSARPNKTLVALAGTVMRRDGRMHGAIAETGRGLPWIEVYENEPFEMPSHFPRGAA